MRRLLLILVLLFPTTVIGECRVNEATLGDYLETHGSNGFYTYPSERHGYSDGPPFMGSLVMHSLDLISSYVNNEFSETLICPPEEMLEALQTGSYQCACTCRYSGSDVPNIWPDLLADYLERNGDKHSSDERLMPVLRSALQDKWPCGFVQRMMHRIKYSWMWDEDDFSYGR